MHEKSVCAGLNVIVPINRCRGSKKRLNVVCVVTEMYITYTELWIGLANHVSNVGGEVWFVFLISKWVQGHQIGIGKIRNKGRLKSEKLWKTCANLAKCLPQPRDPSDWRRPRGCPTSSLVFPCLLTSAEAICNGQQHPKRMAGWYRNCHVKSRSCLRSDAPRFNNAQHKAKHKAQQSSKERRHQIFESLPEIETSMLPREKNQHLCLFSHVLPTCPRWKRWLFAERQSGSCDIHQLEWRQRPHSRQSWNQKSERRSLCVRYARRSIPAWMTCKRRHTAGNRWSSRWRAKVECCG